MEVMTSRDMDIFSMPLPALKLVFGNTVLDDDVDMWCPILFRDGSSNRWQRADRHHVPDSRAHGIRCYLFIFDQFVRGTEKTMPAVFEDALEYWEPGEHRE